MKPLMECRVTDDPNLRRLVLLRQAGFIATDQLPSRWPGFFDLQQAWADHSLSIVQ